MKLVRYGKAGEERRGIVDNRGVLRDLSSVVSDLAGPALYPVALQKIRQLNPADLPLVPGSPRFGPCVNGVGKFVCVGLNYSDHASESKMAVPAEPLTFMKATSAICGANDDAIIPPGA